MTVRILAAAAFLAHTALAAPTHVRIATNLGNVDVTLRPDAAPKTVANFLAYVNSGAYDQSIFHRLEPGFVLQGGGYFTQGDSLFAIQPGPPVVNEFRLSNLRGTVAMAKFSNDPNSAIDQFFFNLVDNSQRLDANNGGFTVFGQVADDASLAVLDNLAAQKAYNVDGQVFAELPLVDYPGSGPILHQHYLSVNFVDAVLDPGTADFSISAPAPQIAFPQGTRGTATVTVTPQNGYQGKVTFACGPLPDFATCLFSPGSVTFGPGSAPQSTTLTFVGTTAGAMFSPTTSAASMGGGGTGSGWRSDQGAEPAAAAGLLAGLLIVAALRKSRRPLRTGLAFCGGLVLTAAGCGTGPHNATPAGTYNLTLRASDGTTSHAFGMTVKIEAAPNPPAGG